MPRFAAIAACLVLIALIVAPAATVLAVAPTNDSFADATLVSALPFSDSVDNTDATVESNEPFICVGQGQTVWWKYTAPANQVLQIDTAGSNRSDVSVLVFHALGPSITDLAFLTCATFGGSTSLSVQLGETYYFQAGTAFGGPGDIQLNVSQIQPPANDNFANATLILTLPFSDDVDTRAATIETGEPAPSCGPLAETAWYSFTPVVTGSYIARVNAPFGNALAAYSGSDLDSLTEIGCRSSGQQVLTFQATAGTTFYFQVETNGSIPFQLDVAPPPIATFSAPIEPSVFDTGEFHDFSFDPAGVGIATRAWNFGDGQTAGDLCCPTHRYLTDGDYTVTLYVTTPDGRSASATRTVSVRTHDIAIAKFSVPTSARSGQTRQLTIGLRNTRYPDTVRVELYRSVPGFFGWEWVATRTESVPVLPGGRTTAIAFNYMFTDADATVGKVSFRAVATIVGARDALLADNEGIASPTKVAR